MWGRARGTEDLSIIARCASSTPRTLLSLLFVAVALDPLLTR